MSHGKPLDAGELRHVVKIQDNQPFKDSVGDMIDNWVDIWPKVYASIDPLSTREFLAAAALDSEVTARIKIRWRAGVTARMRVVHGARIYNIKGVLADVDSGMEYLTLPCSEGTNEG